MNKMVQDLKLEIELIKKTQIKEMLKMINNNSSRSLKRQVSPTEYKRWMTESQALKTQ